MIESSQFLIDDSNIEVDVDRFRPLVVSVISKYNRYAPRHAKFNLRLSDRTYRFEEGGEFGVPDWIPSIAPLLINRAIPLFTDQHMSNMVKQPFPFEYRKPVLYVPFSGDLDIEAVYNYKVVGSKEGNTTIYEVPYLEETDDVFFDLITAKFMMITGRTRRAFTLQDIPLITDADQMIAEGQQLWEQSMEDLVENKSDWYLAWGG